MKELKGKYKKHTKYVWGGVGIGIALGVLRTLIMLSAPGEQYGVNMLELKESINLGNIVSYIVFAVIGFKLCASIAQNIELHKCIKANSDKVDHAEEWESTASQVGEEKIQGKFWSLRQTIDTKVQEHPNMKINSQTLIENYISNEKYQDKEILSLIRKTKSVASGLIIIGVLGTFIGLVIGLMGMSELIQSDMQNAITGLLEGIHTAFYTSIAGIVSSLILQWQLNKFNCEAEVMRWMLKLEIKLNEYIQDGDKKALIERLGDMHQTLKDMGQLKMVTSQLEKSHATLNSLYQVANNSNDKLNALGHLDKINKGIIKMNEGLSALKELKSAAKELNTFNEGFKGNISHLIEALDSSFSMMSDFGNNLQGLTGTFGQLLTEFDKQHEINEGIKNCIKGSYEELQNVRQRLETDYHNQEKRHTHMLDSLNYMRNNIEASMLGNQTIVNEQMDKVVTVVRKCQQLIEHQASGFDTLQEEIVTRTHHAFGQMLDKVQEYRGYMQGVGQNMQQVQEVFEQILANTDDKLGTIDTNMQEHFTSHQGMMTKVVWQQENLINSYRDDAQMTIRQIEGAFENIIDTTDERLGLLDVSMQDRFKQIDENLVHHLDQSYLTIKDMADRQNESLNLEGLRIKELESLTAELRTRVQSVDDSLITSVKEIMGKFDKYIRTTNDILDKKLEAIHNEHLVSQMVEAMNRRDDAS